MIPASYAAWKHCIETDCGILLTEEYIRRRVQELNDMKNPATLQFVNLYGMEHTRNVIQWFEQALTEKQIATRQ